MRKNGTIFLQIVVILIGIGALVFMLWEPQLEGRNAHATQFEIYFKDPFLAYAYLSSVLFFVAMYQAFKGLGYVRQGNTYSKGTIKAVRIIKRCSVTLIALVGAAAIYLFLANRAKDDIAGGIAMGLFLMLLFTFVAITAFMFERRLQNAMASLKEPTSKLGSTNPLV